MLSRCRRHCRKPRKERRGLAAGCAGVLLLAGVAVAGIIIIIRDKNGNKTGQVEVPPGGTVKVTPPKDGSVEVVDDGKGMPKKDVGLDDKSFVPLFNGKDLKGWVVESGNAKQWEMRASEITATSQDWKNQTWVLTEKDYSDFALRLEFRVEDGASASRRGKGQAWGIGAGGGFESSHYRRCLS